MQRNRHRSLTLWVKDHTSEKFEPQPIPQEIIDWLLTLESDGREYTAAELAEADSEWDVLHIWKKLSA